jgi:hypothetical protein
MKEFATASGALTARLLSANPGMGLGVLCYKVFGTYSFKVQGRPAVVTQIVDQKGLTTHRNREPSAHVLLSIYIPARRNGCQRAVPEIMA